MVTRQRRAVSRPARHRPQKGAGAKKAPAKKPATKGAGKKRTTKKRTTKGGALPAVLPAVKALATSTVGKEIGKTLASTVGKALGEKALSGISSLLGQSQGTPLRQIHQVGKADFIKYGLNSDSISKGDAWLEKYSRTMSTPQYQQNILIQNGLAKKSDFLTPAQMDKVHRDLAVAGAIDGKFKFGAK